MIRADGRKILSRVEHDGAMIEYYPSRSRRFWKPCNFDKFITEVLQTSNWKMVKIYELPARRLDARTAYRIVKIEASSPSARKNTRR